MNTQIIHSMIVPVALMGLYLFTAVLSTVVDEYHIPDNNKYSEIKYFYFQIAAVVSAITWALWLFVTSIWYFLNT